MFYFVSSTYYLAPLRYFLVASRYQITTSRYYIFPSTYYNIPSGKIITRGNQIVISRDRDNVSKDRDNESMEWDKKENPCHRQASAVGELQYHVSFENGRKQLLLIWQLFHKILVIIMHFSNFSEVPTLLDPGQYP